LLKPLLTKTCEKLCGNCEKVCLVHKIEKLHDFSTSPCAGAKPVIARVNSLFRRFHSPYYYDEIEFVS
jgi:hypothetical protein